MKKVKVNEEACIGCGACVAIDPEHFAFNDNGLSEAISEENLDTMELQNAIESCPTAAIVMEEITKCNCVEGEECTCEDCHCDECACTEGKECTCDEGACPEGEECTCDECDCDSDCDCSEECSCCHHCE